VTPESDQRFHGPVTVKETDMSAGVAKFYK
jgi:hypothetical protein